MSMQGKVCLITGATNGIGKSTAQGLARMGATVVIVGRDAHKTAEVVAEIRAASGNSTVDSLLADLSSQADVRRLADEFKSKYDQLHVLINNAGATFMKRTLSVDGLEMTFALNHLAYFLLTNVLLDTITASAPARIINVSSGAYSSGKIEFDNLQGERKYSLSAYVNSKLANVLFTIELARRLEGTGITANTLHPGFTSTGFGSNNPGILMKLIQAVVPLIAQPSEKGAETSIYLASAPEVQSISGKYFVDRIVTQVTSQAMDLATAKKLWEVSAELVHLTGATPVTQS